MAHHLKNLSGIPLDIATLKGPAILPANGSITVELSAFEIEAMRHSPVVEISEGGEPDGDEDNLAKLRADYLEVVGKKAYHGWTAEELQNKIDEKLAE